MVADSDFCLGFHVQANGRTLELLGGIVQHMHSSKSGKGLSPPDGTSYPRRGSRGVRPETIHKTPHNPIFNSRYAVTTSTKPMMGTNKSNPSSTGGSKLGTWHIAKSEALAELEAALKTITPRVTRSGLVFPTPSTATTTTTKRPLTGVKRKTAEDGEPGTSGQKEQAPPSKKAAFAVPGRPTPPRSVARPFRVAGSTRPALPSRFGPSAAQKHNKTPATKPLPRATGISGTPATVGTGGARAAQRPKTPAAERAQKANDAYIARMRKAQQLKGL